MCEACARRMCVVVPHMRRVAVVVWGVCMGGRTLCKKSELAPRSVWPSEGESEGEVAPSACEMAGERRSVDGLSAKLERQLKRGEELRMGAKTQREELGVKSRDAPSTCEISCEMSELSEPQDALLGERRDAPRSCEMKCEISEALAPREPLLSKSRDKSGSREPSSGLSQLSEPREPPLIRDEPSSCEILSALDTVRMKGGGGSVSV